MYIRFVTDRKISMIRAVRTTHRLGLKEAKDLIECGGYTSDADEMAFAVRCIPDWKNAVPDLKVEISTQYFPTHNSPVQLFREAGATPVSSAPGNTATVTSVSSADIAQLEKRIEAVVSSYAGTLAVVQNLVGELVDRVTTLESAPSVRIIERNATEEEAAW